jgi:hypothetical protein
MQLTTNHIFLFLGTLMYLGTGWPLILFSSPLAAKPCPDNYYKQFGPQVTAATRFFTVMTVLRVAAGIKSQAQLDVILRRWMALTGFGQGNGRCSGRRWRASSAGG